MKKGILVAAVLTGALTVGAVAQGMQNQNMMQGQQGNMQNKGNMQSGMMMGGQQGMGMQGRGMGMQGGMMGGGMQMFSQLNLTSEQRFQLSILKDEMRLEMKKLMHAGKMGRDMGKFIKGDSFDKSSFKEHMNKKHEKMLNIKADNMEKAFKILTKEQITQLKQKLATK